MMDSLCRKRKLADSSIPCEIVFNDLVQKWEGKSSETDSIKFKISSKTPRGKKDSTKIHHHRHHKRQPGEQQFPIKVVTG